MTNLSAAGLTPSEAACYSALLTRKDWKPADLAKSVNETRTNCYKILDKLVALGLAKRFDKDKKLHYQATNPARLLQLAREQRSAREQAEKELELNAEDLMREYTKNHEQPGVRYFQGESEIGQIFGEIATAGDEVVFINTKAGMDFYGFAAMHDFRMLAPKAGVKRRTLTADIPLAPQDYRQTDPIYLLSRTWFKETDYTAPVEWGAFDDKLYIISYGREAIGIIIESQQIADSFKQLFGLLERGQRALPGYDRMPRKAARKSGESTRS